MIDDVKYNKINTIERCLKRIDEEYQNSHTRYNSSFTIQDSIVLNLQRACEASIDLAMHLIAQRKLGIPQTSRDAFKILEEKTLISSQLSKELQAMVGFRNIAVHDYQELQGPIVLAILDKHLSSFNDFIQEMTSIK
ncbi:DUF86 domain-containing protein [Lentisphaera marina]|uniref:type VII toxin-antitoxin system HepT family RNase toxin n=1 Tax=Lentisphaera marina TaxID=1111041 RepID=UPI0023655CF6|nr:DUF86 domain-containing protein [Lentisphaera marina]MDD7986912.1 DUF86 domain-containing protein [Lentisphaera marina]